MLKYYVEMTFVLYLVNHNVIDSWALFIYLN